MIFLYFVVCSALFILFGFLIKDYSRTIIQSVLKLERSSYPIELLEQGLVFKRALKKNEQSKPYFYIALIFCFSLSIVLLISKASFLYRQAPSIALVQTAIIISFTCLLFWLSWIDLASYFLPNRLVFIFGALGLAHSFLATQAGYSYFINHLLAILISSILLFSFQYVVERFLGEGSLGGGDTKLLIALSAWIGLYPLIFVVMYASILFIACTLFLRYLKKSQFVYFPFGPFIAISAYIIFLLGQAIVL